MTGLEQAKSDHLSLVQEVSPELSAPRTDAGNAERLVFRHGDNLRYVHPWKAWLIWDGRRWKRDDMGRVMGLAKETIRHLLELAPTIDDKSTRDGLLQHAMKSEAEPRLRAMISLACSERGIAVRPEELDAEPYLLSVGNGTVNLRTGEFREACRGELLTRGSEVWFDASADCPRWEQFLEEVFAGDSDLIAFVRRWVGYTLTGDTREHALVLLHGRGRNGKSTFVETLKALLGDLAATASFDSFVRRRGDSGPRNDLARLQGARLAAASETGKGRRLDEAAVKQLTGGDRITARFLHAEHFEFTPQFKLYLVTNARPRVDGGDDAIWARLREIPFGVSFAGHEDRELDTKLREELLGILRWAIQGCLEWQNEGLGTAAAIEEATRAYRAEEDVLGAFLAERCEEGGEVEVADLRQQYEAFCNEIGEEPLSPSLFGRELGGRGIERGGKARRLYRGVTLK